MEIIQSAGKFYLLATVTTSTCQLVKCTRWQKCKTQSNDQLENTAYWMFLSWWVPFCSIVFSISLYVTSSVDYQTIDIIMYVWWMSIQTMHTMCNIHIWKVKQKNDYLLHLAATMFPVQWNTCCWITQWANRTFEFGTFPWQERLTCWQLSLQTQPKTLTNQSHSDTAGLSRIHKQEHYWSPEP